jgi:hypothetical protein
MPLHYEGKPEHFTPMTIPGWRAVLLLHPDLTPHVLPVVGWWTLVETLVDTYGVPAPTARNTDEDYRFDVRDLDHFNLPHAERERTAVPAVMYDDRAYPIIDGKIIGPVLIVQPDQDPLAEDGLTWLREEQQRHDKREQQRIDKLVKERAASHAAAAAAVAPEAGQ